MKYRTRAYIEENARKITVIVVLAIGLLVTIWQIVSMKAAGDLTRSIASSKSSNGWWNDISGDSDEVDPDGSSKDEMIEHEMIRDKLYVKKKKNNKDKQDKDEGPLKDADQLKYSLKSGNEESSEEASRFKSLSAFLESVFKVLITAKPKTGIEIAGPALEKEKGESKENYHLYPREYGSNGIINMAVHDPEPPILSEEYLSKCMGVPDSVYEDIKRSHFYVTRWVPQKYPKDAYSGKGIVIVGGGRYSWLTILALENLRRSGSKLPVEVMIPKEDEYEEYFCETLLPKLGAKCFVMTRRIPMLRKVSSILGGYQYKSLALITSSFEQVLLLDADNIPVRNLDKIFDSEPMKSYGMIMWPDYWRRTTHPSYYKIAGIKLGDKRVRNCLDDVSPSFLYSTGEENPTTGIPMHDRSGALPELSSESGEIFIDKRSHMKTLILSLYYNLYGPYQYYPLLSQGSSGEGDKDTFIAAANYYGESVYTMKEICGSLGYWTDNHKEFHGVGMEQFDPIIDFRNKMVYKERLEDRLKNFKDSNPNWHRLIPQFWKSINEDPKTNFKTVMSRGQKPLFYHCNIPKLEPVELEHSGSLIDNHGEERRLYPKDWLPFDFEMSQWQITRKYFCNGDLNLKFYVDSDIHTTDYCSFIERRIEFLKKN